MNKNRGRGRRQTHEHAGGTPDTIDTRNTEENTSTERPPRPAGLLFSEVFKVASLSPFRIVVRGIHQRETDGQEFSDANPLHAFEATLASDFDNIEEAVLRWNGLESLCALDIDRPEEAEPIDENEMSGLFPDNLPHPAASWVTHGGGLRVVFTAVGGVPADALAGAWHLCAPLGRLAGWRCEAKSDTRHPASIRDGRKCGKILRFTPTATIAVSGNRRRGAASPDAIERWRADHGLGVGGRFPHVACPFDACESDGTDPVVVSESGVKCHRCEALGKPSFSCWDSLVGDIIEDDLPTLDESARALVHFNHEQYVLRNMRPLLPDQLLLPAWQGCLYTANHKYLTQAVARSSDDKEEAEKAVKRVRDAGDPRKFQIARSADGRWFDAATLKLRNNISTMTIRELPACRSGEEIERALDTLRLPGFISLDVVSHCALLHPSEKPPRGAITVHAPPEQGGPAPIKLGSAPPSDQEVEAATLGLEDIFDSIHAGLLQALIQAQLTARLGAGTPPIIVVTGLSGSGKTATLKLAAAAVGGWAAFIQIDGTGEGARRDIGLALEDGAGLLVIDEVGRLRHSFHALRPILELNGDVRFAAKYRNEAVVPMRAALALAGSTLPRALLGPEMERRAVGFHLQGHVYRDWRNSCPRLESAREFEVVREPLDVLVRLAWWTLKRAGAAFNWREYALNYLGAVPPAQLDTDPATTALRDGMIRGLYERWRTAPDAELAPKAGYAEGWLDVSPGTADAPLVETLVDFNAGESAVFAELSEFDRKSISEVLGITNPRLVLRIRRRAGLRILKFDQLGAPKGKGLPRSGMPAATVTKPSQSERT